MRKIARNQNENHNQIGGKWDRAIWVTFSDQISGFAFQSSRLGRPQVISICNFHIEKWGKLRSRTAMVNFPGIVARASFRDTYGHERIRLVLDCEATGFKMTVGVGGLRGRSRSRGGRPASKELVRPVPSLLRIENNSTGTETLLNTGEVNLSYYSTCCPANVIFTKKANGRFLTKGGQCGVAMPKALFD